MALLSTYLFVAVLFSMTFQEFQARIYTRNVETNLRIIDIKKDIHSLRSLGSPIFNFLRKRERRSHTPQAPGATPNVSKSILQDKDHNQAVVYWSGEESNAIFVLTRKKAMNETILDSVFYRSSDYGTTFKKCVFQETNPIISMFYLTKDKSKIVLTDERYRKIYYTTDEGSSFVSVQVNFVPSKIFPHPTKSDWLLAHSFQASELYFSMDLAKTWTKIHSYVNRAVFWEIPGIGKDNTTVHMEVRNPSTGENFYKTCCHPYSGCDNKPYEDIGRVDSGSLLVQNEYIFVEKTSDLSSKLFVSYRRNSFREAYFPLTLHSQDFLIMSTSEHQVFVAVNHNNTMVNVYMSDQTGRYFVKSLENVLPFATKYGQFDVDLHQVKSMPGVFVANILVMTMNKLSTPILKTVISFDKGGSWRPIPAPRKYRDGTSTNCVLTGCSLQLHLAYSGLPMMVSNEKAPGLVLAHGLPGRYLRPFVLDRNLGVYISRDGGVTWAQSFTGSYEMNILDQGGAIVAVESLTQANEIRYSFNEGKTWQKYEFSKTKIQVDGLLNEPGINTLISSAYGHSKNSGWIITKIDFSPVLQTVCSQSDYTFWFPATECILGQNFTYERRKQDSLCKNGIDYSRPTKSTICPCIQDDFECDFGYVEGSAGECQQAAWFTNPDKPYADCPEGETFNVSKGYRKVASDKCHGGSLETKYQPKSFPCPLQPPNGLEINTNKHKYIAATGQQVSFLLTQAQGSKLTTKYTWSFGDGKKVSNTSFSKSSQPNHAYASAGLYTVTVKAVNKMGTAQHSIKMKIEDEITGLDLEQLYGAQVNKSTHFLATLSVAQNKMAADSAHLVWTFGEDESSRPLLTWNSSVTHTYHSPGYYTVTVEAVNAVSSMYRMFKVRVYGRIVTVRLKFGANLDRIYQDSIAWRSSLSDSLKAQLAHTLSVSRDYLEVSVLPVKPVKVLVNFVPPKSDNSSLAAIDKLGAYLIDKCDKGLLVTFHGVPIQVINATLVKDVIPTPGGKHDNSAHLIGVYIAIPVLIAAFVMIVLIVLYYRRKFSNLRHYALLRQRPHAESLLNQESEDEDDAPLDLTPGHDIMPDDEGVQPTLVMMTGTNGGNSDDTDDPPLS